MNRQTAIKVLKTIVYIGIYGGLLMPLMFVPVVIFPFVFSKLIYFQILIGLTFPAYLALAWAEPQYRLRKSFLYTALSAYFIALFLSVIFAADPARAWWGNQERMNGLFTLLHLFVWLTMTISMFKTWKDWQYLLNYQVILGAIMAVVALLQKPYPKLLLFPAADRVGGLLDNPIYQGGYQIFILFFIALLWFKTKSNIWRVWYVFAFIASAMAMFAAGSRGPFMGLLFGIILSAVAVAIMHENKKIKYGVVGAVVLSAILYVGVVTVGVNTNAFHAFENRFPTASRIFELSVGTQGRFIAWKIAGQGFLERPLTGWGLDNFHILFNEQYNPNSLRSGYYETWFDRAHNTVMDVISMTGIIGLLTFFAVWVAIYYTVINARRKKRIDIPTTAVLIGLPAAYFLQNLFVFDHPAAFSMSYLLYAFVICIGFAGFSGDKDTKSESRSDKKSHNIPWVSFGVVQIFFLFIVIYASYIPAKASALTIKFNEYFSAGQFDTAYEYAEQASSMNTPYLSDQTYLYAKDMMALADMGKLSVWPKSEEMIKITEDVNERLLATHGNNAHPRFIYASFLQSMGRALQSQEYYDKAEQQLKEAIKLSPKRQQLYFSYGRLLIEEGRLDEAMQKFMQAASFDEQVGESWWYVAVSYEFDQQNPEEAAKYYKKAYEAEYPYGFRSAQEAWFTAKAYERLGEPEGVKKIIASLPNLPAAPAGVYIQIAAVADRMGLLEERDLILGAVFKLDPTAKTQLQALINGDVDSIDEALAVYNEKVKQADNSEPTTTIPGLQINTSTTAEPTTASTGTGPRL